MIIVLRGADFSGNNIGTIDIPVIWDTDALAFLEELTTPLSDVKKKTVNRFFQQLKSAGIYSKLKWLVLPILGLSDSGLDIVTKASVLTIPEGSTFSNLGVTVSKGFRMSGFSRNDGSAGVYNSAAVSTSSGTLSVSIGFAPTDINSGTNPSVSAGRAIVSSATLSGVALGGTTDSRFTLSALKGVGLIAASSNSTANKTYGIVDGTTGVINFSMTAAAGSSPCYGGLSTTTDFGSLKAPIAAMFMGFSLTTDELVSLSNALDSVVNGLK